MAAYTSTQSGNFNDSATWGGGGFPTTGDTATIAANHVITVPASTTSTCGAVTFNAGSTTITSETRLVINGTFEMGGNITTAANSRIQIGPGGVLDLNGNTVAAGAALTYYEFKGTSDSHCSVISTGTAGTFTAGSFSVISDWEYCDVSGLGDSVFGRTHVSAYKHNYIHCTFTGCGSIDLEAIGTNQNAGILVAYCDFRNPSSATPIASNKYYPGIYQSGAVGTAERVVEYCTWDSDSTTAMNYIRFRCLAGLVVRNNIFNNVRIDHYNQTYVIEEYNNFFSGNVNVVGQTEWFVNSNNLLSDFHDNYGCYLFAEHPFASNPTGSFSIYDNVFEYAGGANGGKALNWFVWGSPAAPTINIKNNLVLGEGNLVVFTGNSAPTLLDISNNTFYVDNDGTLGGGLYFSPILFTEQASTLTGTVNIYNNIVIDPDTTGDRDAAIDLLNNTADQVDFLDYNVGWGYPDGALTPPVLYADNVVVSAGEGVNDFSADPSFIDKTRKLSAWDSANGGAGTVDNAVAKMLLLNSASFDSAYTVNALIAYVKEGFTPTNSALKNTGYDSLSIGAMEVVIIDIDRIAEQGAIQYAIANKSTQDATLSRLGGAGYLQGAIADAVTNNKASATASRLAAQGRIYAKASE